MWAKTQWEKMDWIDRKENSKSKKVGASVATKESIWGEANQLVKPFKMAVGTNIFSFSYLKAGFSFRAHKMNYWARHSSTCTIH